jgi:hypothetical protein
MMGETLMYLSVMSPLFGIFIGFKYRKLLPYALRYILALMILSFASDAVMLSLSKMHIRNLPIAHIYGLLEGVLFLLFFKSELTKHRMLVLSFLSVFVIFYCIDSLFIEGFFQFNAYSRSLEAFIMIILSVFYFYKIYETEANIYLDKSPEFWIAMGTVTYFSGAFFSFLLSSDILAQSYQSFYGSWILHNIANVAKNILFFVGLWKVKTS